MTIYEKIEQLETNIETLEDALVKMASGERVGGYEIKGRKIDFAVMQDWMIDRLIKRYKRELKALKEELAGKRVKNRILVRL